MKKKIMKAIQIEIKFLKNQLAADLCQSIKLICEAYCQDKVEDDRRITFLFKLIKILLIYKNKYK